VQPAKESLKLYPPRVMGRQSGKKRDRRGDGMVSTISGRKELSFFGSEIERAWMRALCFISLIPYDTSCMMRLVQATQLGHGDGACNYGQQLKLHEMMDPSHFSVLYTSRRHAENKVSLACKC
jgi:hypothetical protein